MIIVALESGCERCAACAAELAPDDTGTVDAILHRDETIAIEWVEPLCHVCLARVSTE